MKVCMFVFGHFPESEQAQERVLSPPLYPELSEMQIEEVVDAINEFSGQAFYVKIVTIFGARTQFIKAASRGLFGTRNVEG